MVVMASEEAMRDSSTEVLHQRGQGTHDADPNRNVALQTGRFAGAVEGVDRSKRKHKGC